MGWMNLLGKTDYVTEEIRILGESRDATILHMCKWQGDERELNAKI